MFTTENLVIRLIEEIDIEEARHLHNISSTINNLTNPEHISVVQQQEWFKAISTSRTSRRYILRDRTTSMFVGMFRVDMVDNVNKSVMVGLDIVPDFRGRGLSYETYECFLQYYFNTCGFNRVYLLVLETNEKAIHIYKKLGFVEEGRQRKAIFRGGKYVDYIMMSILRQEQESKI